MQQALETQQARPRLSQEFIPTFSKTTYSHKNKNLRFPGVQCITRSAYSRERYEQGSKESPSRRICIEPDLQPARLQRLQLLLRPVPAAVHRLQQGFGTLQFLQFRSEAMQETMLANSLVREDSNILRPEVAGKRVIHVDEHIDARDCLDNLQIQV